MLKAAYITQIQTSAGHVLLGSPVFPCTGQQQLFLQLKPLKHEVPFSLKVCNQLKLHAAAAAE